ncbi:MAG: sugar phosphate isomerase/epimerase [Clostridia bacterium]|nr:sugar phosphate isomerase/epimerase [Clostridia bacterium]
MMQYGLQLYSLRDMTGEDFEGALRTVAELGYSSVETAGFFGHSAEEVAAMLDRYHLTISSSHTGWRELTPDKLPETIRYHKTLGNPSIIVPGADLSTPAKLDAFIDLLNDAEPKLAAEGIALGYHNHDHEFMPNSWGILPHSEIERRTRVELQIDTYWAYVAGLDPVETITRLRDRIRSIHLKDGDLQKKGFALSEGAAPVAAVRKKAIALGFGMIVESEGCDPTGAEEIGRCIRYLRKLDAED